MFSLILILMSVVGIIFMVSCAFLKYNGKRTKVFLISLCLIIIPIAIWIYAYSMPNVPEEMIPKPTPIATR